MRAIAFAKCLFVLGLYGLLIFSHIGPHQPVSDDAFIHFRIAQNFAVTGRPFFNNGSAVSTSSSIVWSAVLAALEKLNLLTVTALTFFNCGTLLLIPLVVACIGAELGACRWRSFLSGCLISISCLNASMSLMETPFAILLTLVAIALSLKGAVSGAVLFGTVPLARPELSIAVPLFAMALARYRRIPLLSAAAALSAGALVWLVPLWYWFGDVVPQSIRAKTAAYVVTDPALLFHSFVPPVNIDLGSLGSVLQAGFLSSLICGVFGLVLRSSAPPRAVWLFRAAAVFGITVAALYFQARVLVHEWYAPLILAPLLSAAWCGIGQFQSLLSYIPKAFLCCLPLTSLLTLTVSSWSGLDCFHSRINLYFPVGQALRRAAPKASVLASEIGVLGYTFGGHIIDPMGLASPQALAFHPLKVPDERSSELLGAIPPRFVEITSPEVVVTYPIYAEKLLRSDIARLGYAEYTVKNTGACANSWYEFDTLHILIRKDQLQPVAPLLATELLSFSFARTD